MLVETMFSLTTLVCKLKHMSHRVGQYIERHIAYVLALFNALLGLNRRLEPDAAPEDRLLHIAQYAL